MSNPTHRATPEQIVALEDYRLRLAVSSETLKRCADPKIRGSRSHWRGLLVSNMTDVEMMHFLKIKAQVRAELEVA